MEEVKLRVDWYTKAVLTVIALALCWFSVKPLFTAKEVAAKPPEMVDVNIAQISGCNLPRFGDPNPSSIALPVKIEK